MNWPKAALGEVTQKIGSGSTPRGGEESYKDRGIPFIRSMNVYDGEFVYNGLAYLDEEQARALRHVTLHPGDVLLNITGASVARVCRLPDKLSGGRVNQHVAIIRPDNNRLDSDFLAHLLRAPEAKAQLLRVSEAGATREAITKTQIEEFRIPLPPLAEQRRIAAILGKADRVRRLRKRAVGLLEGLTQSIFLEMFGHPAANPHGIPIEALSNVASFVSGGTPSKDVREFWSGDIPWVSPKDMKVTNIVDSEDHVSEAAILRTSLKLIEPVTVLMVVRGMILAHTVPIAITHRAVTINQDMKAIRFDRKIDPAFGLWCLKTQADVILSKVSTAAHGTKRLEMADVERLPIQTPNEIEQQKFVKASLSVGRMIKASTAALKSDSLFFTSLQHRAFSGEL